MIVEYFEGFFILFSFIPRAGSPQQAMKFSHCYCHEITELKLSITFADSCLNNLMGNIVYDVIVSFNYIIIYRMESQRTRGRTRK